jgi:Uma2 family endonuclease
VLSDSSADYDRGEKLDHYRGMQSLREILLVSHREPQVEIWRRDDAGHWIEAVARGGERLEIKSIGCALGVDDLHRDLPGEATGVTG